MGQLIDGVWHDTGTIPNQPVGNFNVLHRLSVTGSPQMARLARPVKVALLPKRPLSSVRFSGLSVGASHTDFA